MPLLRTLLTCVLALFLTATGAQELLAVPPLTTHLMDTAGMLDAQQRTTLDNVLKDYETRSGSQIAILLISSTAPEAIEQYGIRVADAWKLGRKGIDDGVILIVAKDNPKALRRLRIEAGRGIQGTVTDAQSKRILQDVIAPYFRQNDYYGGLTAAITALTALMDQEHLAAPSGKKAADGANTLSDWLPIFFTFLFFSAIIYQRSRSSFRRGGWARSSGIVIGSGALGSSSGWDSGRSSGGGGSSGGGFSGGGGGFDGGGASGDW